MLLSTYKKEKGGNTLATIGERIKELRTNLLGLSMESFGEKLSVKRSAVNHWEKGINNVPESMLKAICREYNVDYFWLTEGRGNPFMEFPTVLIDQLAFEYDLDDYDKSIITEFVKLTKEERAIIVKYMKNVIAEQEKKEPD